MFAKYYLFFFLIVITQTAVETLVATPNKKGVKTDWNQSCEKNFTNWPSLTTIPNSWVKTAFMTSSSTFFTTSADEIFMYSSRLCTVASIQLYGIHK